MALGRRPDAANAPGNEETVPQDTLPSQENPRKTRSVRRFWPLALLSVLGIGVVLGYTGNQALQQSRLREAYLPDLDTLVTKEPYNGRALVLLALREIEASEFASAASHLETAIAAGENGPEVWLTCAAAWAASGDRVRAGGILKKGQQFPAVKPAMEAALQRCVSLTPETPPTQLAEAIAPESTRPLAAQYVAPHWMEGVVSWQSRKDLAHSGFATREQFVKEHPNDAQAQTLWSEALTKNQRSGDAEKAARRALELAPDSIEARLALGDALLAGGAPVKAGLEYRAVLKKKPDSMPALLGFGGVALKQKLVTIAVDVFEKATKQEPKNAEAWFGLGRAYQMQALKLGDALTAFETAVKLAPERTDYLPDYSIGLRSNFRFEEAEAVLARRIAAAPDDGRAHFLLALILLDYKQTPEREAKAEQGLRTALKFDSEQTTANARLGRLLVAKNRPEEGIPFLEAALKTDPYNISALTTLARAYQSVGRTKEAKEAQESSRQLSGFVQRVSFLEDMLRRKPLDADLHQKLGEVLLTGSQMENARLHLNIAHLLRTDRKAAERSLLSLEKARQTTTPTPGNGKP